MPRYRQAQLLETAPWLAEDGIAVRTLGLRLPTGFRIAPHRHDWHQLIYASEGVMTVETGDGSWVVPPLRAAWIAAGFEHRVETTGTVLLRTIYIRPDQASGLPDACCVLGVSPLLRELILETIRRKMLSTEEPADARFLAVLLDQVAATREAPLRIRLPSDPRARRVAARVQADLSKTTPIAELARGSGASLRTIERLFRTETGLTFGRWSQRVRALAALQLLAAGESVTGAALAVGYESTSAFIAMFKRVLGSTPGTYFADATRRGQFDPGPRDEPRRF